MGTCPFSSTCTRTGALGTRGRAKTPPYTNTGIVCSTWWITSATSVGTSPRSTRSTYGEMGTIDIHVVVRITNVQYDTTRRHPPTTASLPARQDLLREPPTLRSLPIRSSVPFQLRERRVLLPQRLERPHRARERREPAPAHYERPDQRRRSSGEKSAETAPTHNLPRRLHEPNLAHRTVPSAATQTLPLHSGFNAVQR